VIFSALLIFHHSFHVVELLQLSGSFSTCLRSLPSPEKCSALVGSGLTRKYHIRLETLAREKCSRVFGPFFVTSTWKKKVIKIVPDEFILDKSNICEEGQSLPQLTLL
jgi:hypothetical protein